MQTTPTATPTIKAFLRDQEVSISVLDLSSCASANRCPSTMGYKVLYAAKGDVLAGFLVEHRITKDLLPALRQFDAAVAPWGLTPDVLEVDGHRTTRHVDLGILGAGAWTAAWQRALFG